MTENTEIDETALAVKIFTDLKSELPEQIAWNYEDLKAALEKAMSPYRGLVLEKTAENVKFAKSNRAKINKLSKAIADARIATKEKFLAPFKDFEEKCNALITECRNTSGELDEFVKGVEAEIKAKKAKFAHDYLFSRVAEEFADDSETVESPFWGRFEQMQSKWQNLTCKETEIKADVEVQIENAKTAISTVKTLYGSMSAELLEKALIEVRRGFDINSVAKVVNDWQKEQERIKAAAEERKRREEAAKAAEEARMEQAKLALEEKRKAKAAAEAEQAAKEEAEKTAATDSTAGKTGNAEVSVGATGNKEEEIHVYTLKFDGNSEVIGKVIELIETSDITCDSATLRLTAPLGVFRKFRQSVDAIEGLSYSNAAKKGE